MDAVQGAVPFPQRKIVMHRALRWQVLGQGAPLAAGSQHVEDAVQNLTDIDLPFPAATLRRWDQRRYQRPLGVGQIAWIAKTLAVVKATVLARPHWPSPKNESMALQNHK